MAVKFGPMNWRAKGSYEVGRLIPDRIEMDEGQPVLVADYEQADCRFPPSEGHKAPEPQRWSELADVVKDEIKGEVRKQIKSGLNSHEIGKVSGRCVAG